MRIDAASPPVTSGAPSPAAGTATGAPPAAAMPDGAGEPCPVCGAARSGRFCETCGFDFQSGTPPAAAVSRQAAATPGPPGDAAPGDAAPGSAAPGDAAAGGQPFPGGQPGWTAVVASDRAYFDRVVAGGGPDAASLHFPDYCPERRFRLAGKEMRIGRRSASRGITPEIDLTGPPADPGISRLHAVLMPEPDGNWVVLDPGSENGTQVNGTGLATGVRVPLHDGDRIHLGAWTVITISLAAP